MSREGVNRICAGFPRAAVSDPWGGGHDAWKVGGKMFACVGAIRTGVSIKTDSREAASRLIEMGAAERARSMHRTWLNLDGAIPDEELKAQLERSYRLIRASLPKKGQAGLG